ncbi:MAG: hypothetical protein OXH72_15050 [Caldilineaceae bacterium]|nr:hypothetical protein [Caldilineaceae bacterium]
MKAEDVVQRARFLIDLFFNDQGISHIHLEELEFNTDDNEWMVTVSYVREGDEANDYVDERINKRLTLTDADGHLVRIEGV